MQATLTSPTREALENGDLGEPAQVLVVDDDALSRTLMVEALESRGYRAIEAQGGEEGLALYRQRRPAVVITDLHMPGMRGLELLRRLREIDPQVHVVLVSGYASLSLAIEAMKAGAADFLVKPFAAENLYLAVRGER